MAKDTSKFPDDDEPEGCRGMDRELYHTISCAFAMARELHHETVALEHVLYHLTFNASAIEVLKAFDIELEEVRLLMLVHLETKHKMPEETHPAWSHCFAMALNRLVLVAHNLPTREATGLHMLHQITEFQESYAGKVMRRKNITRLSLQPFLK